MNKATLVPLVLGLIISCTNPDKMFIEKIKQQVKEDAMGLELNYQNISFQWSDTLYVGEKISELENTFSERMKVILDIQYYARDNFEVGNIFTLSYLTKNRLTQLRNWENNNRGKQSDNRYRDYYQFAFSNRNASAWISELTTQIEETDSLIGVYDNLEEGNIPLLKNVLWYYERIDNYHSNHKPNKLWATVSAELSALQAVKTQIDSLTTIGSDKVIYYKALNIYKINNPIFNGAEQELKRYFLFDSNLEIIRKEDFEM